jgi:hypothetical protein
VFRIEGTNLSPIWCFAKRIVNESTIIYAGTGPSGEIVQSTDLITWSTFKTIEDCHVRALAIWANALFIGTQPKGRIYVHNFTTEQSYLFVETEDSAVVAFAEFGGKLYAGTWPIGIVYGFDGKVWREEYRPYGQGVTAMIATSSQLIVFSQGAEGPVAFNGSTWNTMPNKTQTVASFKAIEDYNSSSSSNESDAPRVLEVSTGENNLNIPTSPQFNLSTAIIYQGKVIAGGTNDGMLLAISNDDVSKIADVGVPVNKLINLDDQALMASSGGTVLLVTQGGGQT